MERRALIAVVLSLAILVLYQEFVLPGLYQPALSDRPEITEAPAAPVEAAKPSPQEAELQPAAKPAVAGRKVTVETDLYRAVFTTAGARLESFELKKYRTSVQPDSPPQQTVVVGQNGELPFGVELRAADARAITDGSVSYSVEGNDLTLQRGESGSIEFVAETDGVTFRKRFTFTGDTYPFDVSVRASSVPPGYSELAVAWGKAADPTAAAGEHAVYDRTVHLEGKKLIETQYSALTSGIITPAPVAWTGFAGTYFLAALIPEEDHGQRLWQKLRDQTVETKLLFPVAAIKGELKLKAYIGPKDFDVLESAGHDLSRAVDLGWFGFIAVIFLHVFKLSHAITGNFGVDIILLTVVIKVLFIPLSQSSFRSMREMQKLQPQMAKIREKFKDNSEQMNKEVMELYRRHKVNPLGGCLPMVLQLPVFFGLYAALMNTVELRHAQFLFWINDLSAPDRLGSLAIPFVHSPGIPILTLLMGGSMFIQQWMTPSSADPQQRQVMMIMPLMFTVMFVNFPSGLSLYWLVNNVLTIAQQYYMNRTAT